MVTYCGVAIARMPLTQAPPRRVAFQTQGDMHRDISPTNSETSITSGNEDRCCCLSALHAAAAIIFRRSVSHKASLLLRADHRSASPPVETQGDASAAACRGEGAQASVAAFIAVRLKLRSSVSKSLLRASRTSRLSETDATVLGLPACGRSAYEGSHCFSARGILTLALTRAVF
eukprot:2034290-Pleurochrysis_carterae.AAC.1